ncbi:phosphotransferase family protein [Amycolatopsis nigrescens]|uniref:phosphotransferase family protein n=1 Tax=Amycolatopsis nigrescens TaxID=381445 RepID=UPI00036DAE1D|nr:aminoglycoside phosphotransferase family protein [Amycolatopsis nigrescens]
MIPDIRSDPEYVRLLADSRYWAPFAREALARHGYSAPERIVSGSKGTYPTMLTDTGLVVKIFGDRWCGPDSHAVESEFYALTAGAGLPLPELLAAGELGAGGTGWPWPYLVTSRMPGLPYRSAMSTMDERDRLRFARELGGLVRRLHEVPLDGGSLLGDGTRFAALLDERRARAVQDHRTWGRLPAKLCDRLDEYLPAPAELLRATKPVLIHGDLHADHVFLDEAGAITGLIDFGDTYAGDPRYELVVLHLGLFFGDSSLLGAFLEGYGWGPIDPHELLAFTLLHDFDVLADFPAERLAGLDSLEQLADLLWSVPPQSAQSAQSS